MNNIEEVANCEITYIASMIEDQPDFSFQSILKHPNIIRGIKRWLSTFVLDTTYSVMVN